MTCHDCDERMRDAIEEGRAGFVMCPRCLDQLYAWTLFGSFSPGASAAAFMSMFIVWAWVDRATYDGHTFKYDVRLDGAIEHLTITGTVSA